MIIVEYFVTSVGVGSHAVLLVDVFPHFSEKPGYSDLYFPVGLHSGKVAHEGGNSLVSAGSRIAVEPAIVTVCDQVDIVRIRSPFCIVATRVPGRRAVCVVVVGGATMMVEYIVFIVFVGGLVCVYFAMESLFVASVGGIVQVLTPVGQLVGQVLVSTLSSQIVLTVGFKYG